MCIQVVVLSDTSTTINSGSIVFLASEPDLVSNDTTTPENKVDRTTPSLPAGFYLVTLCYKWNTQGANAFIETEFLIDGNYLTVGDNLDHVQRVSAGTGDWGGTDSICRQSFYAEYLVEFESDGAHDILLRFKSRNDGRQVSMWDCVVKIVKV